MSKIDWGTSRKIRKRIFDKTREEIKLNKKLKPKSPEYSKAFEEISRKWAEVEKANLANFGTANVAEFNRLFELALKEELEKSQK